MTAAELMALVEACEKIYRESKGIPNKMIITELDLINFMKLYRFSDEEITDFLNSNRVTVIK